jgi:hypothetical protein
MNNYIGIDISINSSAIFIVSNKGETILSFTNKKDNNIYIKELDRCGVKISTQNRQKSEDYSENEILKLESYIELSENIIDGILNYIDIDEKTYCQIEGYSFSKNTSSILDIVSLSSLIRRNLYKEIKNIDITIISPSSLKLETCKLVYKPVDIGKKKPKLKYVNNEGISGGSFKKPQMFRAMIEGDIKSPISKMLNEYRHLMERDKIPNPIEDIIDSIFACIIKKSEIENVIR